MANPILRRGPGISPAKAYAAKAAQNGSIPGANAPPSDAGAYASPLEII